MKLEVMINQNPNFFSSHTLVTIDNNYMWLYGAVVMGGNLSLHAVLASLEPLKCATWLNLSLASFLTTLKPSLEIE